MIRYVINFEDFTDLLFTDREHTDISKIRKGSQYSIGFRLTKENNIITWEYPSSIFINGIEIGATKKTNFGDLKLNISLFSKIGKENKVCENVYIKSLMEKKEFVSPLVLDVSEKINISVENINDNDNVFVDINFNIIPKKVDAQSKDFNI